VCNDFFDTLNGAGDYHGQRLRNDLFKSFTREDDERFKYLEAILQYFKEWREEVQAPRISKALKSRNCLLPRR